MNQYIENKPTADVLMSSMRSIGYSFEAAVADIIDNSISVKADFIEIRFPVDPSELFVAVCDNGSGMSESELFDAMKYGSAMKRENRSEDDLGRFGLGLKAASLSQCRKLTVVSKKDDVISACIWDLDVVEETKDWTMIECSHDEIQKIRFIDFLEDKECGTIVLWENFDVISKSSGNVYAELMDYQEVTAEYLSLIFHRFLNKTGKDKLTIKVNNYTLKGMDPFLENHKKTDARRPFQLPIEDSAGVERMVTVQPYVLPFQKDLTNEDKKMSGGIENYRSKQGFYIYRNERLIVWGTWFGRHRDELTKYARIKVDIPNTLDDIWGIDIKKQSAKIPSSIKQRLTHAVDEAMDIAVRKQTYRGRIKKIDDKIDYIWQIKENRGKTEYVINRDSLIFELIRSKVDDEVWSYIDSVLEEIERSIPFQQIYIDMAKHNVDDTVDEERLAEVADKARILISLTQKVSRDTREQVIDRIMQSEPFSKYPDLRNKLMEE